MKNPEKLPINRLELAFLMVIVEKVLKKSGNGNVAIALEDKMGKTFGMLLCGDVAANYQNLLIDNSDN